MHVPLLNEKLLILQLRKQDPEALGKIYDRYVIPIYRFVYFKVPSVQDAEDITSDVFIRLWNYATTNENEIQNLRAFLYQVARNLIVDFYRRRATRDGTQVDEEVLQQIPDQRQERILSDLDVNISMSAVETVLRRMKDEYREVVTLKYLDELSISEIAEILGKSKVAVRVLLSRALAVTRDLLAQHEK